MTLYRFKEFALRHPWTNENNLRNAIHKSKMKGILENPWYVYIDKALHIDEERFLDWVLNESKYPKLAYLHYLSKNKMEK